MEEEPEIEIPGDSEQDPGDIANHITTSLIIFEGLIGLVGIAAGVWLEIPWADSFTYNLRSLLIGAGAGLVMFLVHLLIMFPGKEKNPLYRWIYRPFARALLKPLKLLGLEDIFLVACISGIGEEIFFRGFLQWQFGIVPASIIFGIIHVWGKKAIPYALYATAMGFYLGGLYIYTGNLWTPILAHLLNNLFGLLAIKYDLAPEI
ncbi:MAG: CPBP family intramembrane glutamic endopeptidase [bacterium]